MSREVTVLPARDSALLDAVETLLCSERPVSLTDGDSRAPLPPELRSLLAEVVRTMRRGQAVTIASLAQQLTTQEAADFLGISRPTLVKLLESGGIPYEQPSRHRRVRLADVLAFQEQRRSERRAVLGELARDAQELGLYDAQPQDYEAALDEARRKHA